MNPQILHECDEGFNVWKRWFCCLFLGFFLPSDFLDLVALFNLRFEGELLLLTIDVELDFSGPDINMGVCCTQEQPAQDERCLGVDFHVKHDEVDRNKEIPDFTGIFSAIPVG